MNKAEKTRNTIYKSLIELLKHKPLDLITVKELTEVAHVSRTSFYNNFNSIDQVLKEIYRQAHQNVFQDKFKDPSYLTSHTYIKDMITFFDDNSDLLLILFKWNLVPIIARYNTQLVVSYIKEHPIYYTLLYWICVYYGLVIIKI